MASLPEQVLEKDPSAVLDYEFDWSSWLKTTETIASYTVTVPPGIVKTLDSDTGGRKVTVWLSGGSVGSRYGISCHIVTTAGREDTRTRHVCVKAR